MKRILLPVMIAVDVGVLTTIMVSALTDPDFGMLQVRAVAEPATGVVVMILFFRARQFGRAAVVYRRMTWSDIRNALAALEAQRARNLAIINSGRV